MSAHVTLNDVLTLKPCCNMASRPLPADAAAVTQPRRGSDSAATLLACRAAVQAAQSPAPRCSPMMTGHEGTAPLLRSQELLRAELAHLQSTLSISLQAAFAAAFDEASQGMLRELDCLEASSSCRDRPYSSCPASLPHSDVQVSDSDKLDDEDSSEDHAHDSPVGQYSIVPLPLEQVSLDGDTSEQRPELQALRASLEKTIGVQDVNGDDASIDAQCLSEVRTVSKKQLGQPCQPVEVILGGRRISLRPPGPAPQLQPIFSAEGGVPQQAGACGRASPASFLRSVAETVQRHISPRPSLNKTGAEEKKDTSRPESPALTPGNVRHRGEENFEVLDVWEGKETKMRVKKGRSLNTIPTKQEEEDENAEAHKRAGETLLNLLMSRPGSPRHLFWEITGLLLITLEVAVVPLDVFDEAGQAETEQSFMAWASRIYWTINLFVAALTGYLDARGHEVMQPSQTLRRYASTWLMLDLPVLCAEWAELGVPHSEALGWLRAIHLLRAVRLIVRGRGVKAFVTQHIFNEFVILITAISSVMLFVVGLTHLIACAWYRVGLWNEVQTIEGGWELDDQSWLRRHAVEGMSKVDRYLWSYHCALGLFWGEHVVFPGNLPERIFTVLMLVVTFILSVWCVSSITTAMTRLSIIASQRSNQFASLSRFLSYNRISRELAAKVQLSAKHAVARQKRTAPESTVELLHLISEPLRIDIHFELNSPALLVHPFLKLYSEQYPTSIRKTCHHAVQRLTFSADDVVFSEWEVPAVPKMFFVVAGRLNYDQTRDPPAKPWRMKIGAGAWLSEAVLWTRSWTHYGTLRASTRASTGENAIAALDAQTFQAIATKFPLLHVSRYARDFVSSLAQIKPEELTDVGWNIPFLESVARDAFSDKKRRPSILGNVSAATQFGRRLSGRSNAAVSEDPGKVSEQEQGSQAWDDSAGDKESTSRGRNSFRGIVAGSSSGGPSGEEEPVERRMSKYSNASQGEPAHRRLSRLSQGSRTDRRQSRLSNSSHNSWGSASLSFSASWSAGSKASVGNLDAQDSGPPSLWARFGKFFQKER